MKIIIKNLLLVLVVLGFTMCDAAFSADTANINIKIAGALGDNRYFLCVPNVRCLSILAAARGKIFPVFYPFEMKDVYTLNLATANFRIYGQPLPSSCSVKVGINQTITIYGKIGHGPQNSVFIDNAHCKLS